MQTEQTNTFWPRIWDMQRPWPWNSQVGSRNWRDVGKEQVMKYSEAIIMNLALVNLSIQIRKSLDGLPMGEWQIFVLKDGSSLLEVHDQWSSEWKHQRGNWAHSGGGWWRPGIGRDREAEEKEIELMAWILTNTCLEANTDYRNGWKYVNSPYLTCS